MAWDGHTWGQYFLLFPANLDLVEILGDTEFDSVHFIFFSGSNILNFLTSPGAITAARPHSSFGDLGQGLWDSSTSAILCIFGAFWEPLGAILEIFEPS